jgi:hypothetical protein
MIIRITEHVEGVEKYLTDGRKMGRTLHRDDLDKRVPIYGDLAVFEAAQRYTQKNKRWKNAYWHITISPPWHVHAMASHEWRQMVISTLEHYFHLYRRERLAAYAEIHYPRVQSIADPETHEPRQRLPHIHLVVSKLDLWGDNQLRIIPYKKSVAAAFQRWLGDQHPRTSNTLYDLDVQASFKIVQDYQTWHREENRVDITSEPYAPQSLLKSPSWQALIPSDIDTRKRKTRFRSIQTRQIGKPKAVLDKYDALAGFRQWLEDLTVWFSEKETVASLIQTTPMKLLLNSAHQDFGLLAEHYRTRDHVLVDQRTGRADSAINFAYHVLNLPMKKSIEWVACIQGLSKTIENEDDHNDELGIR